MVLINPNRAAEKLAIYLSGTAFADADSGVGAIYPNNTAPTSGLPESYLEIVQNGPVTTLFSEGGIQSMVLMLTLSVKLRDKSVANTARENFLFNLLSAEIQKTRRIEGYTYEITKDSAVYSGRDLSSGYSTKIFNIKIQNY